MTNTKYFTIAAMAALTCSALPMTAQAYGASEADIAAHEAQQALRNAGVKATSQRGVQVHRGQPLRLNYNAIATLRAQRLAKEQADAQTRLAFQLQRQANAEARRAGKRDARALDIEERFLTDTRNQRIRGYYNGRRRGGR